jgi:hypothetical protein
VFFLSFKANARVKPANIGYGPHTSKTFCVLMCVVCSVSFCVVFLCKCVLYYCHRVATKLQLTNICIYIQGVPGGMCETSGECSLGQTIPI